MFFFGPCRVQNQAGMNAGLPTHDKALDASERVINLLADTNKAVVIPPSSSAFDRFGGLTCAAGP